MVPSDYVKTDDFGEPAGGANRDPRTEAMQAQLEQAEWEIESRDATIEAMSRQLRAAEHRVRDLGPLESSAKLQVLALKRTLPLAARKRIAKMRSRRSKKQPRTDSKESAPAGPPDSAAFLRSSNAILGEVLAGAVHEGAPDVNAALALVLAGEPLTAAHAEALVVPRHHPPTKNEYPADLLPRLHSGESTSEGTFEELVTQVSPDLLTVDIWDTLILRNRPPDAAKTATARRMMLHPRGLPSVRGRDPFEIAQVRVDVEAELANAHPGQEYELTEVLRRTLEKLGHPPGSECRDFARALTEAEISDEIAWSWVRQEVLHVTQAPGRRTLLASDFYMTGDDLKRIVSGVVGSELETVVSIDRGISKRLNGELFNAIRAEHGTAGPSHLHIGDNEHSDVNNQLATGGLAIHVPRWSRFPAPGGFNGEDLSSCWAELDRRLALFDADHPVESHERLAGRDAAIFAVALVARGLEEAWQHRGDRVHYVSREGIFLTQVHEAIEPILRPFDVSPIRPIHLALSRRATFGASLELPLLDGLQRMWSMYREQSVAAMLISIGQDPDPLASIAERHGLAMEAKISEPWADERVRSFLIDKEVSGVLEQHIRNARDVLRAYVLERTHLLRPFIVIDIGWRGTIQDNLVQSLGVKRSLGIYFGLFPFLNEQPAGATKIGVCFDGNLGEEYEFAHPPAALERPWTPDVPSTIGFTRDPSGHVAAVVDQEKGAVSSGILEFQQGTLEVAPIVAEWLVGMGLSTSLLRRDLAVRAKDYWLDPSPGVADIWFDSDHDDSFGALNEVSFGKLAPNPEWLGGPLRRRLEAGERASDWAPGYRAWRPVRSVITLARTIIEESE